MKEEDSLSMSKSYDAEGSRAWPWRGQARGPVGQGGEPRQAHPTCPAASGSSAAAPHAAPGTRAKACAPAQPRVNSGQFLKK